MNRFWKLERKWEEVFQQLQSIKFLWASHYFIKFACRDFNVSLKFYAVIKFRAKLKIAQLANFHIMSRHKIVCRDILNLWWDKSSQGCDIRWRHKASQDIVKLSRQISSFDRITLVATLIFCRDFSLVLPSALTKSQHQLLL